MEDHIEDRLCMKGDDIVVNEKIYTKGDNILKIELALQQIATSLQHAAEGYLSLATSLPKLEPYELPQAFAQIPPPPTDVPLFIRKTLSFDGEGKSLTTYSEENMN